MNSDINSQIENILDYLSLCEASKSFSVIPIGLKSSAGIKRLNPLLFDAQSTKDEAFLKTSVSPFEYRDFTRFGNIAPGLQEGINYCFWQVQKVDVKALRGLKLRTGLAVSFISATITEQGEMSGTKTLWQWDGKKWVQEVDFAGWGVDLKEEPERTQARFSFALQLEDRGRQKWAVEIGYEGMPTIELWTDPEGAKEVFRLRGIPAGKQRRTALRHWVTEHWRRKPVNEGEVKIAEHLRGAEHFVWNGMICNIRPSQTDLQKAVAAKAKK